MRTWPLHAAVALVVILMIGLVHHETAASITRTWSRSVTYNHGWLIIPISAWLIWRERRHLSVVMPRVWWPGIVVFVGLELLWILGAIADVVSPQQIAVVAMIPATVLLVLGPRVARNMLFPLCYLVFAIPMGDGLVPFLQDITAYMAVGMLDLAGMPYFWEGRLISTPAGDFEVAEACSGVRYLIASLALGTLYAFITYRSAWRRTLFIAASILVPILANGVRAWGIVMLASLSDMTIAVGVDHLIYGWVFFGIVMFILFWLGSFWREPARELPGAASTAGAAAAVGPRGVDRNGVAALVCTSAAAVVITLVASQVPAWSARLQPVPATEIAFPAAGSGWSGAPGDATGWFAGFEGAHDVRLREYRAQDGDGTVTLLAIHYRSENQGRELIRYSNRLDGDGWYWIGAEARAAGPGNGREVRELRLRRGSERRMLWTWYDIGGWQTTSAAVAKGYAALNRLTGRPGDATLVVVATDYALEPEDARPRLEAFLADHPRVTEPRGLIREN